MIFGIITHAIHKSKDGKIYAYEPYVREMNLWAKNVDEIIVLAPISKDKLTSIETAYLHSKIKLIEIPDFNITSVKNIIRSILVIPKICILIFKVMKQSNHIHLRCPGNIGLLGCFVQILFPYKSKTVKYAGNWDHKSKQPLSYRIQKWILSNSFLTRNCKVLVYGKWKNQSKNIIPFFTASYKKGEIIEIPKKNLHPVIKFIFVGTFSEGKQPLLSVKTIQNLLFRDYKVQLDMYGEGDKFNEIKKYIIDHKLENNIFLHGNQIKEIVKKAYQESNFLIFISKSEGWPKVVAEAMFWRCLPISSNVSCVEYMLGKGVRGTVVESNVLVDDLVSIIVNYIENDALYQEQILNAQKWSRKYTLDRFSLEIKKILNE
ncbi:glycosyl transferase [Polaribacter sp. SA4-10]|uniref:glycosyltransferase n=1 Tax=Polaribacter sp. SA4-10 TaxID=754397 RepID=UPI000B3CAE5F|nr:glycosyltransferase [Polaribacter sp. SA4-10]ARV05512.1 glycosyl transferase [Polaribacter sp. SA4-10]